MDTVKSTNNWLSTFFLDFRDEVLAIEQTEGKGRRGNIWTSDLGGLYFSFVSPNNRLLPFIAGISVVESLVDIKDKIRLKWPNDIIVNRKKLGGILCESSDNHTIVGIGLNINNNISLMEAISLEDIGYSLDRLDFIYSFRANFSDNLSLYSDKILKKYTKLDILIDKNISWDQGSGIVKSIDKDGSLVVETLDKIVNLYSEEVSIEEY
jgi:BirA family biotin operon repressor/biotin-[acetyl-CoA-carboxylase] ligase